MKKYILVILVLSLFSCGDDQILPLQDFPDKRLVAIRKGSERSEIFSYHQEGNNTRVDLSHSQEEDYQTNISYVGNLPVLIERYITPDNELISFDSLIYNADNTLLKIQQYFIDDNKIARENAAIELIYGNNGYPGELHFYYPSYAAGIQAKQVLRWKDGNLVEIDYYSGEGDLRHEYFIEYDNQFNYKFGSAYFFSPENWSKNNVIKASYKDYTGLLDTYCNPCIYAYEYDNTGMPIKVTTPEFGGESIFIEYESTEVNNWSLPFQFNN